MDILVSVQTDFWKISYLCKKKNYKKGALDCDKVYQLLAYGRRFSLGTPASSTTKTGRHDIAEILQNVTLNTMWSHVTDFS